MKGQVGSGSAVGAGWGSGADSGPGKSGDSTGTAVAWVFLENFGCQRLLWAASAPTQKQAEKMRASL